MKADKTIMSAILPKEPKTSGYDTEAQVLRIEGSTAWVHIPGGVEETPVAMTINASPGDTVRVRVAGGSAWLIGNDSAPPTDDKKAVEAQNAADSARSTAREATKKAEQASKVAGDTAQHFWFTEEGADTGAHITEVTQEEFLEDPANGGGNLLARSNGIAVRNGMTELATFTQNGVDVFGDDDSTGTKQIASLGYEEGYDEDGNLTIAPCFTLGTRSDAIGNYSAVIGQGSATHFSSFAIGEAVYAQANYAQAFGFFAQAEGKASHAEGFGLTTAVYAGGIASHAEGASTTALGDYSHAQNYKTRAYGEAQTVLGRLNKTDTTSALVIGNGQTQEAGGQLIDTYDNALTVGWDGEVKLALDTSGTSGMVDDDLYDAIVAAGWTSDVIE